MTILPLIGRQLRVRARSPAGYWTRFGAALAGTLLCLSMLTGRSNTAQMSAFAFQGLVAAAFVLCCFSGFLTVDGISRERRDGTLGLLLLTRVKTLDVLLGNFGATGIASLCALTALTPVLIVPVLAGGVTGGEAARKVLALFDTMILSLAAGLWASAGGREWRSCARSAAKLLLLLVFGPLLLEANFPLYARLHPWFPSPLSALGAADDAQYRSSSAHYWASIAVVHAISWFLVICAGIRFRRALREDGETPDRNISPAPRRKAVAAGEAPPDFEFLVYTIPLRRKPLAVGDAPLDWLVRRQSGVRTVVWAVALLESAYQAVMLFFSRIISGPSGVYSAWGMSVALALVEGCLFGWAASRFFVEARRGGELELLLTTPEGAKTIVASQWKWLKEVFRWPVVVLIVPWVIWNVINMSAPGNWWGFNRQYMYYSLFSQLFSSLNTFVGIVALLWAGMWFGWSERSQTRAIVRILIVAKGASFLIGTLAEMLQFPVLRKLASTGIISNISFSPWVALVWSMPQIVTLLFYLWLIRWARRRLAGELPQAETGF